MDPWPTPLPTIRLSKKSDFLERTLAVGSGGLGWKARSTLPSSGVLSILFTFFKQIVLFPWLVRDQGSRLEFKSTRSCLSLLLRWFLWHRYGLSSPTEQGPEPSLGPDSWVTPNRLSLSLKFCICLLERAYCLHGGVRFQWYDVYKASMVLHTVGAQLVPSPPSSSLALFHPQLHFLRLSSWPNTSTSL